MDRGWPFQIALLAELSRGEMGMCAEYLGPDLSQQIKRDTCLEGKETRTNQLWHIYYASKD
ncbi:hypothetical protein ELG62_06600 [Rhizobium leguminosarum]|nr:hypothetical protein ELG62_06600 [Rhizobium leguminosarum]